MGKPMRTKALRVKLAKPRPEEKVRRDQLGLALAHARKQGRERQRIDADEIKRLLAEKES